MTLKPLLDNAAHWLNEHAVVVVIALAMLALLIEALRRANAVANKKRWVSTWRY